MNTKPLDDSRIARGQRLKKARNLASLTAEELAKKIGYSRQAVSYWENGVNNGLSRKGAEKVLEVLKKQNVSCDLNWLLYGIGERPIWLGENATTRDWQIAENNQAQYYRTQPSLLQEMELYKQNHEHVVITQIKHKDMQPVYEPNDWIGGCFEPIHSDLFGKVCIINLEGQLEVRILNQGDTPETYHLQLLNPTKETTHPSELKNILLKEAAKVKRVWRE